MNCENANLANAEFISQPHLRDANTLAIKLLPASCQ